MLTIRLTRIGKKKQPTYRIVLQEKHRDPWGKALEILGNYNPRTKALVWNEAAIKDWIAKGAQPSPAINNMLVEKKIITGKKMRTTTNDKKPADKKDEKAAA